MPTINERIAKEREKLDQLMRRKRAQEAREKKRRDAINKDRRNIIGRYFEEYFPSLLQLHPHRTEAENKIEFASLIEFLSALASDEKIVCQLNELVNAHTKSVSQ